VQVVRLNVCIHFQFLPTRTHPVHPIAFYSTIQLTPDAKNNVTAKLGHVCRQILRASNFHYVTALHAYCKDAAECTGSLHPNTASRNRTLHVSEQFTEPVSPHTGPSVLVCNTATAVGQPGTCLTSHESISLSVQCSHCCRTARNLSHLTRVHQS
jgi:hypothetical protein